MITLDLSILNQKGTPMFYSDIFANRPAAGVLGRIFISTDTAAIYRDTGTGWDLISDATGSGINIYNSDGTLTGNRTVSSGGYALTFNPQTTFNTTNVANPSLSSFASISVANTSFANGFSANNIGSIFGAFGGYNLQTFAGSATFANSNIAGNLILNSIDFSSAGSTITMTQSSGIRVMSGSQSQVQYQGTNSGTITHAAISQNLGFYRPSGASGTLTITNAYSHLINALDDYGAGFTFTNRWGIYQAGSSDKNYFAGSVLIGSNVDLGYKFLVNGTSINLGASTFSSNVNIGVNASASNNYAIPIFSVETNTYTAAHLSSHNNVSINGSYFGLMRSRGTQTAPTYLQNGDLIGIITSQVLQNASSSFPYRSSADISFIAADNHSITNLATDITFSTTPISSTTSVERARLTSAGNLQLGTTSGGNWRFLCFQNSSTGSASSAAFMARQNGSDDVAQFWVSGSNIASIKSTGNLLINSTSDPGQKLYLNGSLRIDGQSSGTAGGSSGQHLIINLDGTTYKIALLNP